MKKRVACARKGCRLPANWVFKASRNKADIFGGIEIGFCGTDHIVEFFLEEYNSHPFVDWKGWTRRFEEKTRKLNRRLFKD